jgi:UPF0042 nucleotide-binding protein
MSGKSQFVLVTGPSGAGRVTAIRSLEDFGYEVIDNLPLALLRHMLTQPSTERRPLAVGVDVRTRDFSVRALEETVDWLRNLDWLSPRVLFLDCAPEVLQRRFNETRRPHPFAEDEDVEDGIRREIEMLAPLRKRADRVVDTSSFTPHDLRAALRPLFSDGEVGQLQIGVESFSYKKGVPAGLDMALDCRFLRNPHWDKALRALDGRDAAVAAYVAADERHDGFLSRTSDMLDFLLPAYQAEGKSYFTIGFGCTGGQHRSVYMSHRIADQLEAKGWSVSLRHRELETGS